MKTIEYYMSLPYRLEILPDPDESGYVARYPDLPGCLTVGDSMESVAKNAEDAKKEWIAAAIEGGVAIAEPVNMEGYSGQFKLRIPKSLHRRLAEHSKEEGVSMNQYCVYLLSKNDALEKV
ncbi:antitoxin HicB [Lachnospiraceae bacterium]|nr:antitoxin HicB [Lachnospiraceae bacterium]